MAKLTIDSCGDCPFFRQHPKGWSEGQCRHPDAPLGEANTKTMMNQPDFCPLWLEETTITSTKAKSRLAKRVELDGIVFVPASPTKFTVGEDTWHKSEKSLQVRRGRDWPNSGMVSCLDDPQIVFPPAERWVRRDAWDVVNEGQRT